MKEYFCRFCGNIFDDFDAEFIEEDPSANGITGLPPGKETYMVCPNCGSENWREVYTDEEEELVYEDE